MDTAGYNRLATAQDVDNEITRIASEIRRDFPESPLFVILLRGAAPFTSKLLFEIVRQQHDYHPDLDYMTVSTYGGGRQAGEPHIVTDLAPTTEVRGRTAIIIDDVLDKGVTADFVTNHLTNRGAHSVRLAVLCDKRAERSTAVAADYSGFSFDDNWLVGMGMDDAHAQREAYRWLPEIWEVTRSN